MNAAFLCLGGNMGNRLAFLNRAKEQIIARCGKILKESSVYETQSWGNSSISEYLNQCILIETSLSAVDLMRELLDIEKKIGRTRTENKNDSRQIDIDILLFNSDVISDENCTIPHPRMHLRNFVLLPLSTIAENSTHPVFNLSIKQLYEKCTDTLSVKPYNNHVHLY